MAKTYQVTPRLRVINTIMKAAIRLGIAPRHPVFLPGSSNA